jgi:hypothetical protein
MLQITPQMKILVAVEPADFRRGIDGLAQLCREALHQDPFLGAVFVFRNRSGTALKLLTYDGQDFGFATRSSKQKAPLSSALQKSACRPIIGRVALQKLAEWWESRINLAQGGVSCPGKEVCLSPPALGCKGGDSPRRTLDAARPGKAAAGAADSGGRRRSASRAATEKGGGQ